MNRAVQMPSRCWEVTASDEYRPHFPSETEARAYAEDYEEDAPAPAVTRLPEPCWEALCGACGELLESDDYGHAHYPTCLDAEQDGSAFCAAGCESPGSSSVGMEPIPGIEVAP